MFVGRTLFSFQISSRVMEDCGRPAFTCGTRRRLLIAQLHATGGKAAPTRQDGFGQEGATNPLVPSFTAGVAAGAVT